jgi:hypothetical protein
MIGKAFNRKGRKVREGALRIELRGDSSFDQSVTGNSKQGFWGNFDFRRHISK